MYSHIWKTAGRIAYDEPVPMRRQIIGIVPLLWREHCLECAMPLCYKSCEIFKRRMDGRCVRFEGGILPVRFGENRGCWNGGAQITFRRWAKLECECVGLATLKETAYGRMVRRIILIESFVRWFCDIIKYYRPCQVAASLLERYNTKRSRARQGALADGFFAVIKNEGVMPLKMIFEVTKRAIPVFKTSFRLNPGWNERFIPIKELCANVDMSKGGTIRAYLEGNQEGTLIFRFFDLVRLEEESVLNVKPAEKVKCVAWDLDNTFWDGIIGDVGAENVCIREDAVSLVKALDARGVLQTIVSKNTYDVAWPKIQALGLADYFLYPAINWGRKSGNLVEIAKSLNINIDTFALIDDSEFERGEVSTSLPQVRVYDVKEVSSLLSKPEFDIPITQASKGRRMTYLQEAKRRQIKATWEGDYDSFLKSCYLQMEIFVPKKEVEIARCLELVNRSNQYNISGKRYTREALDAFLSDSAVSAYGFRVRDQYGDYGIVGFVTTHKGENALEIVDFVMSCRVAMKKIEQAFVGWLLSANKDKVIRAVIQKTDRNKPLQDVFRSMPIVLDSESEKEMTFHFALGTVLEGEIVEVTVC